MRSSGLSSLLVVLAVSACEGGPTPHTGADQGKPHALLGKRAPQLNGTDVPGSERAAVEHPGEIVIVDFWATHCGPCLKEFPRLQELQEKYAGKVRVVAVSEDEEAEVIPPFLVRTGVKFPMTWDKDKSIGERYSVDSMPQTFVVDRSGVVRSVHRGYHGLKDSEALDGDVKRLLAE